MEEWVVYDWKRGLEGRIGQVLQKGSFTCAFCRGEGLVGPNKKARCQVCGGKGTISVAPPVTVCGYCKGRGMRKPRSFLICTVCQGKGVVAIKEPIKICKACKGRGAVLGGDLPCLACRGIGSVTVG